MENEQSELLKWLDELEAEIAAKAVVVASIRQRLGLSPDAAQTATTTAPASSNGHRPAIETAPGGVIRRDAFFGLSIPDAIKKYLGMAKRPQRPKDIAVALQAGGVLSQARDFYANVTTALKRLRDDGIVVNTGDGWGLAVWYPNRSKQASDSPRATVARAVKRRQARNRKTRHRPSRATGWHQFLGEAAKQGKTMAEAAAEWKAARAGLPIKANPSKDGDAKLRG